MMQRWNDEQGSLGGRREQEIEMTELLIGNHEPGNQPPFPSGNRQGEIFYYGSSMAYVFQPGDRMKVVSCGQAEIRRGDVIVFNPPGEDRLVVHRVIETGPGGIRTRGDGSSHEDPWVLKQEEIRGRVVAFARNGRMHAVRRGIAGRLQATAMRGAQRLDRFLSNILHPLYRRLSQQSAFRRLLPISMAPRIATFGRPEGTDMQILMGRQVIGRRVAGAGWVIKRPYRLFVDEKSLPDCAGGPCQRPGGR
jgi:hypothetical protein